MKTIQVSVAILLVALVVFCGCNSDKPDFEFKPNAKETTNVQEEIVDVQAITLPDYEIVSENTYDAPVKTQIEQHILVMGEINEENQKALLRQQFDSIMQRRGFKYHYAPTNVYIYTYDTKERAEAEQGLWLAMLQMSPLDNGEPKITIKKEQIAQIGQEPKEKFGLPEAKRKKIYKEIIVAERRATDEAMVREPSDIYKQIDLEQKLAKKYKDELAIKYNLTKDSLSSIGIEGVTNQWARPSF